MIAAIVETPSPNFNERVPAADGTVIDMLVLHYTGMADGAVALRRLCDPASRVSAHYLVGEDGTVHALVDERHRAWHAGVSGWGPETDINSRSIGIELVNPGHALGYRDFPAAQLAALIDLAGDIVTRQSIPAHRVLGHSDVAPSRKQDPGERLDWAALARAGIGLWPPDGIADGAPPRRDAFLDSLARFGYPVLDNDAACVIDAFHRHFNPAALGKGITAADGGRIDWLNRRAPDSPRP